jgi:hypothetical protein
MMGERTMMQEALFYEFSLERHVPSDHLLRSIDRFVDLAGVRERRDDRPRRNSCPAALMRGKRRSSMAGSAASAARLIAPKSILTRRWLLMAPSRNKMKGWGEVITAKSSGHPWGKAAIHHQRAVNVRPLSISRRK